MKLIAILFCLAFQRFANISGWFKPLWFITYLKMWDHVLVKLNEKLAILLIIIPILLLFRLLHFIFMRHFLGLFDLVFSVIVLFFCIDARDLKNQLTPYFSSMDKHDLHSAENSVRDFIDDTVIGNVAELPRAISVAILLKSFEQVFVGLFWFIVFGVYGVSTYFLLNLIRQNALTVNPNYIELAKLAAKMQSILEWLPSRILGFSYALVGHFNKSVSSCYKNFWSGLQSVKQYVILSGLASLDANPNRNEATTEENRAVLDLINRTLIIWLIVVALIFVRVWL